MGLVAVADLVTKEQPLDNERRTLQIKLSLMDHLCVCVGGIGIQLMCGLGVILFFTRWWLANRNLNSARIVDVYNKLTLLKLPLH